MLGRPVGMGARAVAAAATALVLAACTGAGQPSRVAGADEGAGPTAATIVDAPDPPDPPDPDATAVPADPPPLGEDLRRVDVPPGEPVVITTAEGDRSIQLSVTATTPGDVVGIRRVTDPAGEVRYLADLRADLVVVDELHPLVLADVDAVGLYVAAPTGRSLPAGDWTVEVAANATDPAVAAVVRSGDPTAAQHLDLVVYAAADLPDPDAVAAAWRRDIDAALAPHGIATGRLDVHVAGEAGREHRTLAIEGLADQVHAACTAAATATAAPSRAALVVLADRIGDDVTTAYRQPDGTVDGFAVATPGTPVTGPASHACVAVAAGEDPAARGLVALHEVLHQAGLTRHTTERAGRDFDDLADTPECPAADHDRDGDLQVSRGECADLGADNLMFWAVGGDRLSADQAWRVRAHPLLRPAAG